MGHNNGYDTNMRINTKYNIGDVVYFINDGRVVKRKIVRMDIWVGSNKAVFPSYELEYDTWGGVTRTTKKYENQLFGSREELVKDL